MVIIQVNLYQLASTGKNGMILQTANLILQTFTLCQFTLGIWLKARNICCSKFWTEAVVEASFTPYYYNLETLAEESLYGLFCHSLDEGHCLNHLHTVKHRSLDVMQLRQCGHNYELPTIKYEFNKRNLIICSLFDYVWWQFTRLSLYLSLSLYHCRYLFLCFVNVCDWHTY